MIEKTSNLDRIFRKLLLSKFFTRGWGSPSTIKRQFDFLRVLADRTQCEQLVDENYPVNVDSDVQKGDVRILDGHFRSPLDVYLPNVMPKEVRTARFQLVVPTRWPTHRKPVCVHMAGTGDHFFWRRRTFLARPLIKEYGIGSLLLENPFYGCRKPKGQLRSSLRHVNELFVMGGGLILEGLVVLHWCEKQGFGPLGLTGISMGGHMASLTATNWHKPIPLIPCLSWSSATPVFTEGVMSGAIPWPVLVTQYLGQHLEYEKEILRKLHRCPKTDAFRLGQEFAWNYPESVNSLRQMHQQQKQEDHTISQDCNHPTTSSDGLSKLLSPDGTPVAQTSQSSSLSSSSSSSTVSSSAAAAAVSSSAAAAAVSSQSSLASVESECRDRGMSSELARCSSTPEISSDSQRSSSSDSEKGRQSESCHNLHNNLDAASSAIEYGQLGKMSLYEMLFRSCRDLISTMGNVSSRTSRRTCALSPEGVRRMAASKDIREAAGYPRDSTPCTCEEHSPADRLPQEDMSSEVGSTLKQSKDAPEASSKCHGRESSDDRLNSSRIGKDAVKASGLEERKMKMKNSKNESEKIRSSGKDSVTGIENYQELKSEALEFMRGVMDVTTFVGNFSTPVDPSLVIVVTALRDGYVPRKGVPGLDEVWNDVEVRYIDCGHISAFLFKQTEFRKAINDAFNKYMAKYEGDEKRRTELGTMGKS